MLLQISDFLGSPLLKNGNNFAPTSTNSKRNFIACNSISLNDIAGVLHNKVLVAAGVSAAIGQLSKPFTSVLFYGKKFDLKAAVQAGGFPSTHSSFIFGFDLIGCHSFFKFQAAVATATSLVFERGFSDAIFGLAAVYAGLIMYDAQGVRREVGTHAKELNKVLLRTTSYSTSSRNDAKTNSFSRESSSNIEKIDPLFPEEQNSFQKKPKNSSLLLDSDNGMQINGGSESVEYSYTPLKESIGHTEMEVAAVLTPEFLPIGKLARGQVEKTIGSRKRGPFTKNKKPTIHSD
ncbi:hypothetical protein DH2020_033167 [Rehmannia glutinosa]|uniref:Acid phosphatase/vanadium-dependent haloperoxidase-related protein n=1 Tax=Rehmannia glutinosa TaxID=99300 RepID=A0ABR0VEY5_REHGL